MTEYNPQQVELKAQKLWDEHKPFEVKADDNKEKYYPQCLEYNFERTK